MEPEAALESEEVVVSQKRVARKPLAERLPENPLIVEEVIEPAEEPGRPGVVPADWRRGDGGAGCYPGQVHTQE